MTKKKKPSSKLINSVIKGLEEKKGFDIKLMDLTNIPNAVTGVFIICSGNSTTQVDALADSVLDEVFKATKEKPWHTEGYDNKEWILIDFVDVVVHVFLPEIREFYGLEELWADAKVTYHETATT
jgi:ribosome-associated protein